MSLAEIAPRARGVPRTGVGPSSSQQPAAEALCGWGRTGTARCRVLRARSVEDVQELLARGAREPGGVIARGAGCSYGDAAQNDGGAVLDTTALTRVCSIDPQTRLVRAQGGATIAELMSRLAAHGLTLPVVPGTRHVTLAGAIASDIHGKNHHRDGAIARHVVSLTMATPALGTIELSPESDPDLFAATLGGMGLTGVIAQATVRAAELPSPYVLADVERTCGLEETLELLAGEEKRRYSVAWMDLLAPGARMGRAVISRADPMPAEQAVASRATATRRERPLTDALARPPMLTVPGAFPGWALRPAAVRAFNAAYWRAGPRRAREQPIALAPFFFPLDVLGRWNRLYGGDGLIQYQYVVPAGREDALRAGFELIARRRLPVYLAVFKRFGAPSGGPLSFPLDGWTLALDMPAGAPGLSDSLRALDQLVAGCGGRVYLSKDARLGREELNVMYPRLRDFAAQRERVDPERVLRSDLGRRLGLSDGEA